MASATTQKASDDLDDLLKSIDTTGKIKRKRKKTRDDVLAEEFQRRLEAAYKVDPPRDTADGEASDQSDDIPAAIDEAASAPRRKRKKKKQGDVEEEEERIDEVAESAPSRPPVELPPFDPYRPQTMRASTLFRQPAMFSKRCGPNSNGMRPPVAKQYASLQLSPDNFYYLERDAKAFVLDPAHPERLDVVAIRLKLDKNVARQNLVKHTGEFLESGVGNTYFGNGAPGPLINEKGEPFPHGGPGPRKWQWPRDKAKIVSLVMRVVTRMVTNERQRKYSLAVKQSIMQDASAEDSTADAPEVFEISDFAAESEDIQSPTPTPGPEPSSKRRKKSKTKKAVVHNSPVVEEAAEEEEEEEANVNAALPPPYEPKRSTKVHVSFYSGWPGRKVLPPIIISCLAHQYSVVREAYHTERGLAKPSVPYDHVRTMINSRLARPDCEKLGKTFSLAVLTSEGFMDATSSKVWETLKAKIEEDVLMEEIGVRVACVIRPGGHGTGKAYELYDGEDFDSGFR